MTLKSIIPHVNIPFTLSPLRFSAISIFHQITTLSVNKSKVVYSGNPLERPPHLRQKYGLPGGVGSHQG